MEISKNPSDVQASRPERPPRADGEQTRERLLLAGLSLFAEKGYAQTSTREIAAAAQANIAAIAYYFEGKAGLYKALYNTPVLMELNNQVVPQRDEGVEEALFQNDRQAWLMQGLHRFYAGFTEPHKCSDLVRMCTRLHMREMIDPTGVVDHTEDCTVRQHHLTVQAMLCRYFDQTGSDVHLRRLEHALVGMGMYLYVGRDLTEQHSPELMNSDRALDEWRERLVLQGHALVELEAQRRNAHKNARKDKA
jgi:TetR/AcrR family transcriptional regulator, regulator of cefoperazone and chloramphenicol sensitivity